MQIFTGGEITEDTLFRHESEGGAAISQVIGGGKFDIQNVSIPISIILVPCVILKCRAS